MKIEDIELDHIIDFIANGKPETAPKEIVDFLEMMEKVRGMLNRFGKFSGREAVINHLMKVDGYSHYMASKFHDAAFEYFYADRGLSKQAWRNRIVERMEKNHDAAVLLAENSKDIVSANRILKDMADTLQLNQPDQESLPEELFNKPFKIYTVDAEMLGLPSVNRYELARIIDELPELSEKERMMAKREAGLEQIKLFPSDDEDARKID